MAGYKTAEELLDLIESEGLWLDVEMSIIGGNNTYGYQVLFVPEEDISYKKESVEICNCICGDAPIVLPMDEFEFDPKRYAFCFVKDKDTCTFFAFSDNEDMDGEQKRQMAQEQCIALFLSDNKIDTKGKLLKILRDGYAMYKEEVGIEDKFELYRDSFISVLDSPFEEDLAVLRKQ